MSVKINIIIYSMYGHVFKLARSVQEGANKVSGVQSKIYRVQDTIPDDGKLNLFFFSFFFFFPFEMKKQKTQNYPNSSGKGWCSKD